MCNFISKCNNHNYNFSNNNNNNNFNAGLYNDYNYSYTLKIFYDTNGVNKVPKFPPF